jgi:hypothetical protein
MPFNLNRENDREAITHNAAPEDQDLNAELPSDDVKLEAEELLDLEANDQLNILILESHALSITATQIRNDFEMLHSRAFLLSAEWKLVSLNDAYYLVTNYYSVTLSLSYLISCTQASAEIEQEIE